MMASWLLDNYVVIAIIPLLFFAFVFISLRHRSPKRPFVALLFDTLCYIPYKLKILKWGNGNDIHSCLQMAIKATNLVNLGRLIDNDHQFLERYASARKLGLARSQAQYSPFGYLLTQTTLTRRLTSRLNFMNYLLKHPRITRIPVKKPIFVIGFTRTGTTFLHELLGLHPSVKMHYTWQQMDPIPKTDEETFTAVQKDLDQRFKSNRTQFNATMALCGGNIQRVHRINYDEPEECTIPLAFDLPWHATEVPWIPFAAKEVVELGAGVAYEQYRKYLQLLAYQTCPHAFEGDAELSWQWMLKCPFHLPYIGALIKAFPDATIVWTHRNPVECIGSACSLYETLLEMAAHEDSINRVALGEAVLQYTEISLAKATETFSKLNLPTKLNSEDAAMGSGNEVSDASSGLKVIHVRYDDIINDPKKICHQIVEKAGLPSSDTAEYESRVNAYLAKNTKEREKLLKQSSSKSNKSTSSAKTSSKKPALHEYHLESYGLSEELVRTRFDKYIRDFHLQKDTSS